ncbi:MAG: Nif3-like dinuclear metal center hexameric protein [Vicinamibacterales bacterium]
MMRLSRREFTALAASSIAAPLGLPRAAFGLAPISASEVIDRIRKNIGVEWKTETVDTLKAGDLATTVSGVVTTAMATMDVLRQAVDAGANMIISCEPTFYGRSDGRQPPAGGGGGRGAASAAPSEQPADPVYTAKNTFIDKHGLVIFRLNQHWRLRPPDPFVAGLARTLGWTKGPGSSRSAGYSIRARPLRTLASEVKNTLRIRGGIRVVGDPQTQVQTVALLPGSTPIAAAVDALPAVDVIVAGEVREWESVEYVRDVAFSGKRKGLVLIGRVVSEEGGMSECAKWLAALVPETSVRHLPAGDPYWRPA